jgi:hypothetical protein
MRSSLESCSVPLSYRIIPESSMAEAPPPVSDPAQMLKEEFRRHLETFYARLNLASPYESVEKAVRTLTTIVHALPQDEQVKIVADPALQWQQFRKAFEASGLAKKHRGIITGLVRDRSAVNLPVEYDHFVNFFRG